jgi:Parvulin-like peptidyl-prolyl isomerase
LQYLIHEIYIGGDSTKVSRNGESLALKLYNQIKQGTPFERVARSFSESASAARSGNLGWINEDQLTREQAYALSESPNGGLSKPIKGAEGVYIFLFKNRRANIDLTKGDISVSLQQIFLPLSPSSSIQEEEAQSSLALSIADSARNCKDMKQIGKELGSNSFNEIKNVKLSRLNTDIRPIAEKLELQKASDPIRMSSGILVLMVCGRNSSSEEVKLRKKLLDSYSQIQAASISKRMLRNLKRRAFIEVR